jgi:multifunctional beta-oxidation protein
VVNAIRSAGGEAVADYNNVEYGEKIIETAIQIYGRIDVLINNAGILRDVTVKNMTDKVGTHNLKGLLRHVLIASPARIGM